MLPLSITVYRYIGLAILAVAFGGFCFYKGYSSEHDKLVAYQAKITQTAQDQSEAAKRKDAENEAQTLAVAQAYGDDVNRLSAALERLRNSKANSSKLPSTAQTTNNAQAPSAQPSNPPASVGWCDGSNANPCLVTRQFFDNALKDAQDVDYWFLWATQLRLW